MGSMVSVRIMRRISILVVLFDWKLRIELDRGGVVFEILWGPARVYMPRSRYFSNMSASFRIGEAVL